jgi:4-aminobutyrate aminotransferase-like enzyme
VRFLPPLTLSDAEFDEAMDAVDASVDEVAARLGVAGA